MDKILRLKSRLGIDKRGVTLIEILVTLVIVGIAMAAVYEIYLTVQKQGLAQDEIAEMSQNVRIATDQIMKELRLAGYNTATPSVGIIGSVAANNITLDTTNTNSVTLRGDFDETVAGPEEVKYDVVGTSTSPMLVRCYRFQADLACDANPSNWPVFAPNVTSIRFDFYNNLNSGINVATAFPATDPTNLSTVPRRVAVEIRGRTNDRPALAALLGPTGKTTILVSDAVMRNFGAAASDTIVPTCPTNIQVTATGNCGELRVTWQWADSTPPAGDLAGFIISYEAEALANCTSQNPLQPEVCQRAITLADPNARSYFLQRLKNISYKIDVKAYDNSFNKSACPPPAPPAQTQTPTTLLGAPPAPTGFQAVPGNNKVTLTWNPIDMSIENNRDVKGYRIYRDTTAGFTPNDSTNMIACERTKAGESLPTGCPTGKNLLSTPDAEAGWSSVTSFDDTTAVNCTKYYYIIKSVDQCNTLSLGSAVVNAAPPDNDKKPNTPSITSLVAGNDTTIIVNWTLAYDPADTTHSAPDRFRVYYKISNASIWDQLADIPISLTGFPQTLTGNATLNGLQTNKPYDVKVSALDAMCGNEAPSTPGTVSTVVCAPLITWGTRGGHFIYPGINATTGPLTQFSKVGTDPDTVANSRFITWVVDPLDCTADSNNYDRQGFDYNNPPDYTTGWPTPAQVEFYINNSGALVNTPANSPYNEPLMTHIDTAPRGLTTEIYYHWPITYPYSATAPTHIDTTRLCNGQKDFKIRAMDGVQNSAENTIILEIKNGGIVHNSSQVTITNITTPDDFHNEVKFGLRNSSTTKDLKVTKMTLSWTNTLVNLKKIEVLDSNNLVIGLFEDTNLATTPPVETTSGTEVTLTTIPNIPINSTATVRVTFTKDDGSVPSTADMRGKSLTLNSVSFQDNADLNFNCTSTGLAGLATLALSAEPVIGGVVQDKPFLSTTASTTPGLVVAPDTPVEVSLPVTDLSATVTSVRAQYAVVTSSSSTAPIRPSNLTDIGNYPNLVTMVFDSNANLWKGTIPANNNSRIWYFIEALDSAGNLDISPEQGAYTYAQCGTTLPTVAFISPTPAAGNINNIVTVRVSASSAAGISSSVLFTTGVLTVGSPTPVTMTQVAPGEWQGSYDATAGNLKHTLNVKVTDNCGNQQTIQRAYN